MAKMPKSEEGQGGTSEFSGKGGQQKSVKIPLAEQITLIWKNYKLGMLSYFIVGIVIGALISVNFA